MLRFWLLLWFDPRSNWLTFWFLCRFDPRRHWRWRWFNFRLIGIKFGDSKLIIIKVINKSFNFIDKWYYFHGLRFLFKRKRASFIMNFLTIFPHILTRLTNFLQHFIEINEIYSQFFLPIFLTILKISDRDSIFPCRLSIIKHLNDTILIMIIG